MSTATEPAPTDVDRLTAAYVAALAHIAHLEDQLARRTHDLARSRGLTVAQLEAIYIDKDPCPRTRTGARSVSSTTP